MTAIPTVAAAADFRQRHIGLWAVPRPRNALRIVELEDAGLEKLLFAEAIVLRQVAHTGLVRECLHI